MKKNLYYRHVTGRENFLKMLVYGLAMAFASYPKLLIEVFIRKDFGERYFNFMSSVSIAVVLAIIPLLSFGHKPFLDYVLYDGTYYAYLVLFVLFSYWHEKDIERSASSFDFAKYSLCSGTLNPFFTNFVIPWNGQKATVKQIECFVEPAPFFIAGLVLLLLQQKLGILLTVCSFIYGLSYLGAYSSADAFVLDKIDEMIVNEEMEKAFVEGKAMSETKGFQFRGRKPASEDMRRKVLPLITEETEVQKEEIFLAN